MELLIASAIPVVGAGAAFVLSVAAALLMFSAEAWVAARLPNSLAVVPLRIFGKAGA